LSEQKPRTALQNARKPSGFELIRS
jgi:hypothetical protein